MATITEGKDLICEMCRMFYNQGWVTGTGGGISIKVDDTIVMAPSGVQKERMQPEDMFLLDAKTGAIKESPRAKPAPHKPPKLSECAPLFQAAYEMRGAGAVLHSHSLNAVLASLLDEHSNEFSITHLEMIKGIAGHGYHDSCVVPIIENTARECELTGRLREAIQAYPKSNAVLVRRHGVYVWGPTWVAAKTQAECYDYLFEAAVRMRGMGIDASKPLPSASSGLANGTAKRANGVLTSEPPAKKRKPSSSKLPTAVVLDIEGTIVPLSFVSNVLFPYAKTHLRTHLYNTWDSAQTQSDIALVRNQCASDHAFKRPTAMKVPVPGPAASREDLISAVIANLEAAMAADEKNPALKTLQGHVWHAGFEAGELCGALFDDVLPALAQWHSQGIKTYIYSSGSRTAQADLFSHTQQGDVREYLSGFFDTSSGAKVDVESYHNLALSIGAEASRLVFATDVAAEAVAAKAAGWQAVLVMRPGNKPLAPGHGCPVVESLTGLIST
ncbi:hypothetical protein WJX74_009483 [Apatococcus lobatus]|uniref:Probable methylthioribulose-1-phosphate dehydratase n=1 Tax=Apatococcus lobatus TaxID=904363 RepID=A0AAW1RI48_9CHLO